MSDCKYSILTKFVFFRRICKQSMRDAKRKATKNGRTVEQLIGIKISPSGDKVRSKHLPKRKLVLK